MKHPLEPISADEINIAVDLCRSYPGFYENALFVNISLVEPEKEFVRNYKQGDDCPRTLKIRGIDSKEDGGFVAIIDLKSNNVNSLNRVSGKAQVTYSMAEVFMTQQLTKADASYQEA